MRLPVILATLLVLLPCSCAKQPGQEPAVGVAGSEIAFGAATGYLNGAETRTIYSGEEYSVTGSSNPFERIDWVAGEDDMTIFYNQQSDAGTYVVTGVSGTSDENSYAQIESLSGKLCWGTEAEHRFYAMYPKNGVHNTLTSAGHVTGMIPGGQTIAYNASKGKYLPDMSYAYMVAYAGNQQITQGRVDLPFTPAMTAFEFRLQRRSGDGDVVKLTKFELISASAPLTGTFAFDITGGDDRGATWNKTVGSGGTTLSGTGTTITVNFPTGGVPLPAHGGAEYLDFTVFALPVALSGLSVRLSLDDGSKLSVPLNDSGGSPHTFAPCKKHVITNTDVPDQEWEYVLGDITGFAKNYQGGEASLNGSFVSYRQKTATSGVERREAIPFVLQHYDETTSAWVDGLPSWLANTSASGIQDGSTTGSNLKLNMSAQTNTVQRDANGIILDEHTLALRSAGRTPHGTLSGGYHDLSTYNVATGQTIDGTSANCYVVDAPGSYLIPMVYGNGKNSDITSGAQHSGVAPKIDDSSFNPIRYSTDIAHYSWLKDASSVDSNLEKGLYDHRGSYIDMHNSTYGDQTLSYPYIVTHVHNGGNWSSAILWEDSPELVTNIALSGGSQGGNLKDNTILHFEVPASNICQGNAVVAILYNGTVAWSWHIWVTDEDLTQTGKTFPKPTYEAGYYGWDPYNDPAHPELYQRDYYYAPVNIGWCDGQVEESYAFRSCRVRVVQQTSGIVKEATVTQAGRRVVVRGNSPYFQYGRKDPLPAYISRATETESPAGVFTVVTETQTPKPLYPTGTSYAYAYSSSTATYANAIQHPHILYRGVPSKYNLWNTAANPADNTLTFENWKNENVRKSVYDPSPVGFKLGPQVAFGGFTAGNFTWSAADGTRPAGRTYTGSGLFFPATGYLRSTDGTLADYGTATYRSANWKYSLFLDSSGLNVEQTGFAPANAAPLRPVKQYPQRYPF